MEKRNFFFASGSINEDKEIKSFIAEDIMKFVINLIKKYKSKLGYKILSQIEEEEEIELKTLTINFIDILFYIDANIDFANENAEEESDDSFEISSDDENININNLDINELKKILYNMSDHYYKNNKSNNIFNDVNDNKICKKRKSDSYSNNWVKHINEILKEKDKDKIEKKKSKKNIMVKI